MKNTLIKTISLAILTLLSFNTFVYASIGESVDIGEEYSILSSITYEEGMNVDAKSALLVEPVSGTVLYEKNSEEKFAPASVTKIMTMLLAIEAVDNGSITLSDKIVCSENAKNMGGSTMLLDTGEVRTVEEILKGIAIASGNDAAVAMAEYLGGSVDNFVSIMNKRAKELGMVNTNFKNCNGLPEEGHYTTAKDISIMSLELLKHPSILKYTGTYMETISEGRKSPIELVNHNKLVRFFNGCDGLKTGYTEEAKYCISATAVRDGIRMLAVIMGAPTYKVRNRDASMLMNYGFSKYEGKKIFSKDEDVEKIFLGKNTDRYLVLEKGTTGEPENKITLNSEKDYYKEGEIIGICEVLVGDKKVGEVELYCDRDVEKANFFENIKYNLKNLFKEGI